MKKMKFTVSGKSENTTKIVVDADGFKITVDEPVQMGGTNEGPSPVHYLLSALAGCLNVTGHFVAREMGIEMKGIKVSIEGILNPCKFMGMDSKERSGFQQIIVSLTPLCDVDSDTLKKWKDTVEQRCPVTDNLKGKTEIMLI